MHQFSSSYFFTKIAVHAHLLLLPDNGTVVNVTEKHRKSFFGDCELKRAHRWIWEDGGGECDNEGVT